MRRLRRAGRGCEQACCKCLQLTAAAVQASFLPLQSLSAREAAAPWEMADQQGCGLQRGGSGLKINNCYDAQAKQGDRS